jgi:hypothetical protein
MLCTIKKEDLVKRRITYLTSEKSFLQPVEEKSLWLNKIKSDDVDLLCYERVTSATSPRWTTPFSIRLRWPPCIEAGPAQGGNGWGATEVISTDLRRGAMDEVPQRRYQQTCVPGGREDKEAPKRERRTLKRSRRRGRCARVSCAVTVGYLPEENMSSCEANGERTARRRMVNSDLREAGFAWILKRDQRAAITKVATTSCGKDFSHHCCLTHPWQFFSINSFHAKKCGGICIFIELFLQGNKNCQVSRA